jgi:DNA polymerase elongation subunit (family B)
MVKKHKTFKELKRNFWLNPYIAFWCTSYARAILMDFLSKYPNQIIQYDTDSLYYLQKGGEELEKALLKYNDDILIKNRRIFRNEENPTLFETLGQWDFDDVYIKFMGMGAKKYIKQDKDGKIHTVIAGLPKGAIPKEIEEKGIKSPFNYYNPLIKYMQTNTNKIIVNHVYAHKFASVYCDDIETHYETISDYQGNTTLQEVSSYHAIIPIDYTLTMSKDYILEIIKNRAAK